MTVPSLSVIVKDSVIRNVLLLPLILTVDWQLNSSQQSFVYRPYGCFHCSIAPSITHIIHCSPPKHPKPFPPLSLYLILSCSFILYFVFLKQRVMPQLANCLESVCFEKINKLVQLFFLCLFFNSFFVWEAWRSSRRRCENECALVGKAFMKAEWCREPGRRTWKSPHLPTTVLHNCLISGARNFNRKGHTWPEGAN